MWCVEVQLSRWIYKRVWRAWGSVPQSPVPNLSLKSTPSSLRPDGLSEIQQHIPIAYQKAPSTSIT